MRLTAKRLGALKGSVVQLQPRSTQDWTPKGILVGFNEKVYRIELDTGKVIEEPRHEFLGMEEVEQHPDLFRRQRREQWDQ